MISSDSGIVKVNGDTKSVMADLSTLIHALLIEFNKAYGEETAKELLDKSIADGFKTLEEIQAEIPEDIEDFIAEKLKEVLTDVLKDITKGDKE